MKLNELIVSLMGPTNNLSVHVTIVDPGTSLLYYEIQEITRFSDHVVLVIHSNKYSTAGDLNLMP